MKLDSPIPLALPVTGPDEIESVSRVLRSGWLTQGPETLKFEGEFAHYVGAKYACAVSNCTAGLFLALKVLDIGPGDEVIVPSHSFISTANAIIHSGATPVFIDIDPMTYNLDPDHLESAYSKRTRAVLCVHQLGMPCNLSRLSEFANQKGIALVEDAACAIGSEIQIDGRWEKIGKPAGDLACFSFHPRKIMTTGDGGMITTSDPEIDQRLRRLRQQGMDLNDLTRHKATTILQESYGEVGYNFRLTDLQAAIGRVQLKRIPDMISVRRAQAKKYLEAFAKIPGVVLPLEPEWARSNYQSFCLKLPSHITQGDFRTHCLEKSISTRKGVMCAHREPAYENIQWLSAHQSVQGIQKKDPSLLSKSEQAQDGSVMLPIFNGLTEEQQNYIIETVQNFLKS